MKQVFLVEGFNWEMTLSVDTEIFPGLAAYYEAVTLVMETLYRHSQFGDVILRVRLFDNHHEEITLPSDFSLEVWRRSEGILPAPEWDVQHIYVKEINDEEYSIVDTLTVLRDACLTEILNEVENHLTLSP
jgi:hypothetical protein